MSCTDYSVTIICLAYNHEKYIEQALDSMLFQKTTFKYKILVHDDCSSDMTQEILLQYKERYPDIVDLILEPYNRYSKGQSFTDSIKSKIVGKYVALCEGDDFWIDESKLQVQYDFMESHAGYSLIVHSADVLDDRTGIIKDHLRPANHNKDFSTSEIIEAAGWLWATNSMFFKAELYGSPEAYRGWGVGDYPTAIYLSTAGKVRYIDRRMSVYRSMSEGSWSSRIANDGRVKIQSLESRIAGISRFDSYTERRYSKSVEYVKGKWRCEIGVLSGNWEKVVDEENHSYFHFLKASTKFSMWLHCNHPAAYQFAKRLFLK